MTDNQPRQPEGRPEGGQWAANARPEGEVNLMLSDAEYNRTGTFLFPPRPRSATQQISFWTEVEIEDAVLENIALGYEKWAYAWHQAQKTKWLESEYFPRHRIDVFKYRAGMLDAKITQQIEAAVREHSKSVLEQTHPRAISPVDVRDVARAGQMYFWSGALPEEDQEVIDEYALIVEGKPMMVRDIVDRYSTASIRTWFAGPTRAIVESLEQVRLDAREDTDALLQRMD